MRIEVLTMKNLFLSVAFLILGVALQAAATDQQDEVGMPEVVVPAQPPGMSWMQYCMEVRKKERGFCLQFLASQEAQPGADANAQLSDLCSGPVNQQPEICRQESQIMQP